MHVRCSGWQRTWTPCLPPDTHRIRVNLPEGVRVVAVDCRPYPDPFLCLLAPEERGHAATLTDPRVRARFVHCRGTLRTELGALLGLPPDHVPLGLGQHGKPMLMPTTTPCTAIAPDRSTVARTLDFSVSHAGDFGLVALSHIGPVGVDLEPDRAVRQPLALANRFFPAHIIAELEDARDEPARTRLFLHHWTRLEAEAKAHGLGLLRFLQRIAGSPQPDSPQRKLLESFSPHPGYHAALCVLDPLERVSTDP